MNLDLARWHVAGTTVRPFLFVPLMIGLAVLVAHADGGRADPVRPTRRAGPAASDAGGTHTGTPGTDHPRVSGPRVNGPRVVVLAQEPVSGWVDRWCRSTGRRPHLVPVFDVPDDPAAPRVAELAATSARLDVETLLLHRSAHGTGPDSGRVVVAVQSLPDDAAAVAAAECAAAKATELLVVHAVPASFGERSVGLDAALDSGATLLADAQRLARSAAPGTASRVRLIRALPHEVVGAALDADLVVLGGPRPGADGVLGLVALSALHHAPCSVLLVAREPTASRAAQVAD